MVEGGQLKRTFKVVCWTFYGRYKVSDTKGQDVMDVIINIYLIKRKERKKKEKEEKIYII